MREAVSFTCHEHLQFLALVVEGWGMTDVSGTNEWISLAFIKLGIDRPEAVIDRAFVENHALVPKIAN